MDNRAIDGRGEVEVVTPEGSPVLAPGAAAALLRLLRRAAARQRGDGEQPGENFGQRPDPAARVEVTQCGSNEGGQQTQEPEEV